MTTAAGVSGLPPHHPLHALHPPQDIRTNPSTATLRRASLTAGVGLALMSVLAAVGVFGATAPLITSGDAARTAADILGSEGCGSAAILIVNAAKRAEVIPTSAFTQLVAPLA